MKVDEDCVVDPDGPCLRCKSKKVKCSLMPINPRTGKTDRRTLSQDELLQFRIKQKGERRAPRLKKGKQRARDSSDTGEPAEASGSVPSPLAPLASLGALTLDSGASSTTNTPANSPATAPIPPLPECPASAPPTALPAANTPSDTPTTPPLPPLPESALPPHPPTAPKAGSASTHSSKSDSKAPVTAPSQHLAGFVVEVPMPPHIRKAALRRSSRSSNALPVSDDETFLARIAAVESKQAQFDARIAAVEGKQEKLEEWMRGIENRLNRSG